MVATAKRKTAPRPLPVVQPGGVVVYANAKTLPTDTCHLSHCTEVPAPGPTLLCAGHLALAKTATMQLDGDGYAWGACLLGCGRECQLGKWTSKGNERHHQPPKSGCEHLPAHMIHLAQGTLRRRAIVDNE